MTRRANGRYFFLCRAACRAYSRPSQTAPILRTASFAAFRIPSRRVWARRAHCYRPFRRAILSHRRAWRLIHDPTRNLSNKTCGLKEQKKPPPRRLTAVYQSYRCACPERFLPSCWTDETVPDPWDGHRPPPSKGGVHPIFPAWSLVRIPGRRECLLPRIVPAHSTRQVRFSRLFESEYMSPGSCSSIRHSQRLWNVRIPDSSLRTHTWGWEAWWQWETKLPAQRAV